MKKILSILLIALMATGSVQADDVSAEQALQIARQFANGPTAAQARMRRAPAAQPAPKLAHAMKSRVAAGKDNVYVVNYGNDQGFVIVSGETGADDMLLGYCDHGSFSYDDAPIQLKDLLASYSKQVDSLRQNPTSATHSPRRAKVDIGSVIVGPLLTTTWSQWRPYNDQCPEDKEESENVYVTGGRYPTGCYPTALAQVMNYWKWPKQTTGKVQVDYLNGEYMYEDFSGHVYDWDNMLDSYESEYDAEQAAAVAKLMADIGTAFHTWYGHDGSPTMFLDQPLVENFGYSPDVQQHRGVTAADLIGIMKEELDQFHPILYAGKPYDYQESEEHGHALVCDGYTSSDYFHFNYGWAGYCDGWYKNALCRIYYLNSVIYTGVCPLDAKRKEINGIEYALFKNGEAHILQYNHDGDDHGNVTIPDEVTDEGNAYQVTRICKRAFYSKGNFNTITLGSNVKSIDPTSFLYSHINTLVIGDKMEVVPDGAFQLTGIRNLAIGASVKQIGKQAFRMCEVVNVVSKSPAFEVGEEAFYMNGEVDCGDWLGCITKLGTKAFSGVTFKSAANFAKLEEIGSQAFSSCSFPGEEFIVPPTLKSISPDAFKGSAISFFSVQNNPNFLSSEGSQEYLCNSNGTSLIMTVNKQRLGLPLPETVVKLEPRSIRSADIKNIPATVVEMEGAYSDCSKMRFLRCYAVLPPVISDTTFNESFFLEDAYQPTVLYVPAGTEELYRNASGWRRFMQIIPELEYNPMAAQSLEYNMIVAGTDNMQQLSIPISEVSSMEVSDDGKSVIIKRKGKEDITTTVAAIDSIKWVPGFVYDGGEVFNVNDSTLTAKAQNCTVTLSPTVIDRPAQLIIRNSVLTPEMAENMVRGVAVDISLSTGEHDLTGMVKIAIPFEMREGETLKAVYFNRETGEWEPTYFWYDEDEQSVVILTSHFTEYGVCSLRDVNTPMVTIEKYDLGVYDFTASLKKLYDIASKEDVDAAAVQTFRDDYSFWQAVGIDGGWNALQACGFNDEAIGNACDIVGYLGTAVTVLDVAKADLNRDDIGVASNSMKAICGFLTGKAASAIGTSLMQTSMVGVAAIGILLEKFGTMVQQRKKDLVRAAYRHYYSEAGVDLVWNQTIFKDGDLSYDFFDRERKYPNRQWRSKRDWNMYFRTAIDKGKITPENFQLLIEQAVRMYCQRFWDDNHTARSYCYDWAKAQGLTSQLNAEDDKALQQQISDEYFAELMAGDITEVFSDLRKYCEEVEGKRVLARMEELKAMMNTVFVLKPYDSTWKKGEKSKYAGWRLRFAEVPADAANPADWECVIADNGTATLKFTKYALVKNQIKAKFILTDDRGIDQKVYEYRIPNINGKRTQKIDLATGGTEVEAPEMKDLELTYDPDKIENANFVAWGYWGDKNVSSDDYHQGDFASPIYLSDPMECLKKTRYQYEIEKFFKRHDFITVDALGNVKIGDDIVAKFEGETATGKFTIDTTHPFSEQTVAEFASRFNNSKLDWWDRYLNLLNGTIKHKIDCTFTVTRDGDAYIVDYTGTGSYDYSAKIVECVDNVDWALYDTEDQHIVPEDCTIGDVNQTGNVTLKYKTKLK